MGIEKETPFISDITKEANVDKNEKCLPCDKMFQDESELKVHVKKIHLKIKEYFCDKCDKSFSGKSYLNGHLSTHLENDMPCYICGAKLSKKKYLIKHIKSSHTGTVKKPQIKQKLPDQLPCHVCGKLFNSNKNLRLHDRRRHNGSKLEKAQRFPNSFKLEVLEKVKEVGILAARKTFGIHEKTIKG